MRQRTLRVGGRLERAALVPSQPPITAPQKGSIALGTDAGHVRSVRRHQVRSFEVLVALVGGAEGKAAVFGGVPAEADRQQQQLRGVLRGLGATPSTPVTILSDGADGPRALGEAACIGPTSHVLDWFHLAMRIQHVAQAAKGGPPGRSSASDGAYGTARCGVPWISSGRHWRGSTAWPPQRRWRRRCEGSEPTPPGRPA